MEEQYQRQLLKYRQPSEFFKQLQNTLESQKRNIENHVRAGTGDIWLSRQREVNSLLDCLKYTAENRANGYYKSIFGISVYDDSMLHAECVKFCKSAERVIWHQWLYNANALIYKVEEILNSLKYNDSMVYLNARMISAYEEQLQLKTSGNLLLAKQLEESQTENALLKKQLAEVTLKYDVHSQQIKELQNAHVKMEQNFQRLREDNTQLLQKAEEYKREAERYRKEASAYSPSFVRVKHVVPLFQLPIEKDRKETIISTTNHSPSLCCPIHHGLMKSPVILTLDGHTYDQEDIAKWINQQPDAITFRSPKTNQEFPKPKQLSDILIENIVVKNLISEYIGSPRETKQETSPKMTPSLTPGLSLTDS